MNPNEDIDLPTLLALQKEQGIEALKTITDRMRVQDMGPADHIETKHEVKAFLISGDAKAAVAILKQAEERLAFWQRESARMSQERGYRKRW